MPQPEKEIKYYEVMPVENLPAGKRVVINVNKQAILIFNVNGQFFAIGNECTHDDGSLREGDLEGYSIVCPRHGAEFDIRTGQALCMPAIIPVPTYPLRENNGKIEIGFPVDKA